MNKKAWALLACMAVAAMSTEAQTKTEGKRGSKPATDPSQCLLSEFRAVALSTHDPELRHQRALEWIKTFAGNCTPDQFLTLRNNRSLWLGTSDTNEVASALDVAMELANIRQGVTAPGKPADVAPAASKPTVAPTPAPKPAPSSAPAPAEETTSTIGSAPPPSIPAPAVANAVPIIQTQPAMGPPPVPPAPTQPAPKQAAPS